MTQDSIVQSEITFYLEKRQELGLYNPADYTDTDLGILHNDNIQYICNIYQLFNARLGILWNTKELTIKNRKKKVSSYDENFRKDYREAKAKFCAITKRSTYSVDDIITYMRTGKAKDTTHTLADIRAWNKAYRKKYNIS
jgi:hypothetical protein